MIFGNSMSDLFHADVPRVCVDKTKPVEDLPPPARASYREPTTRQRYQLTIIANFTTRPLMIAVGFKVLEPYCSISRRTELSFSML